MDKQDVLKFLQDYVYGFMYNDINNCIQVGANFGVATLLLSYTENMGSLINGHLGLKNKSHEDFDKMLEYFDFQGDQNYYKDFRIKYKEDSSKQAEELDIYTAFRCGFIHEYFPKLPCIVHNNPQIDYVLESEAGIHWYDDGQEKRLRFHTNAYYRDFKNAIDKIKKNVEDQTGTTLTENIIKSLERITSRVLVIP